MKNFIHNGDTISVTAPAGGIASGQGIIVGSLFGMAAKAASEGESVEIATVGVYELPKAPATVIGQGVLVGSLFGVAAFAAAEGADVEIATRGVFDMPKALATVIAQGARVAWDDTAKQVVLPGAGLYLIGVAVLAAGNGATVVRVRLDGVATEAA